VEVDDDFDAPVVYEEALAPPWWLLVVATASVLISAVLLAFWGKELAHLAGYALAALVSVTAVALYRYIDGRRMTLARYRPLYWTGKVNIALLALAWIIACGHAWALATIWAR
jgi:hypothetical protein